MELQQKKKTLRTSQCRMISLIGVFICSLAGRRMLEAAGAAAMLQVLDLWVPGAICWHRAQSAELDAHGTLQLLSFADGVTPIQPSWMISWALQSKCSPKPSTCKTALLVVPPGVLFSWSHLGFPHLSLCCWNSVCSMAAAPDPRGTADGIFFFFL